MGHNYETLDELTQLLFLFEHFDEVIGKTENGLYLGRWRTRWTAIEGVHGYFDKITEELVEAQELLNSGNGFLRDIGTASGTPIAWMERKSLSIPLRTSSGRLRHFS